MPLAIENYAACISRRSRSRMHRTQRSGARPPLATVDSLVVVAGPALALGLIYAAATLFGSPYPDRLRDPTYVDALRGLSYLVS